MASKIEMEATIQEQDKRIADLEKENKIMKDFQNLTENVDVATLSAKLDKANLEVIGLQTNINLYVAAKDEMVAQNYSLQKEIDDLRSSMKAASHVGGGLVVLDDHEYVITHRTDPLGLQDIWRKRFIDDDSIVLIVTPRK